MENKENSFLHNINFFPIPEKLKSLLVFIAFRCQRGSFKQSDRKAASVLGCTDRSIRSRLQELNLDGWIIINNPGDPRNRTIQLTEKTNSLLQINTQHLIDKAEENFLLEFEEKGRNLPINAEENFLVTRKKSSNKAEENFLQNNNSKNNFKKNKKELSSEIENRVMIATKVIAEFFSISEVRQPKHYMTIGNFVRYHSIKGNLDFLAEQFTAYCEIKSKDPKFKHNWYNYIGSPEKSYEDGQWNIKDWMEELKRDQKPKDEKSLQAIKRTNELLNEN